MKLVSLRCCCGHHTRDLKRPCIHADCACRKFNPGAGQKGLNHWADLLGPLAPSYTLCYRVAPLKLITHNPESVNCPDCQLELKHRAYLSRLRQLAAKASYRANSKSYKGYIRPLDLLTKEQMEVFEKLMEKRGQFDDRYYCSTCDCRGCHALGRHLGPLVIGFTALDSIRKEIKMLLAIPGLAAERRRQADAFLRHRKLALASRQF